MNLYIKGSWTTTCWKLFSYKSLPSFILSSPVTRVECRCRPFVLLKAYVHKSTWPTADKIGKNYRSHAMHSFPTMIYKTIDVLLSSQLMRSLNDMFESKQEYIYIVMHSYKKIRKFFFEGLHSLT